MAIEQQVIQELNLENVMGDRFGRYSKYIIQDRALPDIRDGLKPVQRRILYAMYHEGNTSDKQFRKSAKTVGNVIGNYHPHGDSSVYEAMVRLSQDWKLRDVLVEMHGNNGSMDGDPAAAMRYTEARLSKISEELLRDIEKNTVDFVLNFDDTDEEPTVLPARFPNLLVNGSTGISAGYATEIPTHNLGEVIDATIYTIDHPHASVKELMQFVKGPDFPTGAIIQGIEELEEAYETGKGKVVVRSKTSIENIKGGKMQIVISEIPYEVNKAGLVKKIDEIRINRKIEGIAEVRDESDRSGLQIVVELKKEANAEGILNYLLKNTDLQINYNFNMVAIKNRRPMQVGLKDIITAYIGYQKEIITKRTKFDLEKAQNRLPIINPAVRDKYGLEITSFILENVSVPPEVEQAIDKRSSMSVIGNLNDYVKYQMGFGMGQGGEAGAAAAAPAQMAMGFAMAQEMMRGMQGQSGVAGFGTQVPVQQGAFQGHPGSVQAGGVSQPNTPAGNGAQAQTTGAGMQAAPGAGAVAPAALDVLTPAQAAQLLSVSEEDIMASIQTGDLKARKIGNAWRIARSALDAFLRGE